MEIFKDKNKRKGLIGTLLFHAFLIILFSIYGLTYMEPKPQQGITINFGTSEDGMGNVQPEEIAEQQVVEEVVEEVIEEAPQPAETQPANMDVTTQETTETIHVPTAEEIAEENRKKEEAEKAKKKAEAEQKRKEAEAEAKAKAQNLWNKVNNNSGGSEGETGKPGDQGKENGDKNATSHTGGGGGGNGISFNLSNRNMLSVPKIIDNSQDEGKVVVDITVGRNGQVIKAIPGGQGSTTTSGHLFRKAKEAALKTKFSPNPDAPEEQRGQMTFVFILE